MLEGFAFPRELTTSGSDFAYLPMTLRSRPSRHVAELPEPPEPPSAQATQAVEPSSELLSEPP